MTKPTRVLFAGGGSLGSVYPALSIARWISHFAPDADLTFVGDGRPLERNTVTAAGLRYTGVPGGEPPQRWISSAAGWIAAAWQLRERETDLVVSVGGHAAGPVVHAARWLGAPYLLVEQNALPEPSTVRVAADAAVVCLAHEETAARLPFGTTFRTTGGIARPGFEDAFHDRQAGAAQGIDDPGRPRLVVLGGVAGASSLNESMPAALARLGDRAAGWRVVHQTGDGWLARTDALYRELGIDAVVVAYIDELAHVARSSDLVVCRPGGSTLAELAVAGLPALLVPDSRRRDGLHAANARLAAERYGCPVIDERSGRLEVSLAGALADLLTDESCRRTIARRLARDARPDAARDVAAVACEALGLVVPSAEKTLRVAA